MSKRKKSTNPIVRAMRERIRKEKIKPLKFKYYFMDKDINGSNKEYIYRFGKFNVMQNQGA